MTSCRPHTWSEFKYFRPGMEIQIYPSKLPLEMLLKLQSFIICANINNIIDVYWDVHYPTLCCSSSTTNA